VPSQFGFRHKRNSGDDGAGWIYADLFLALTIVGLGSAIITSGNALGSDSPSAVGTTVVTTTTVPTFQLSCAEFAIKLSRDIVDLGADSIRTAIESGVAAEISSRGWSVQQAKPGLAILAGGFDVDEEHSAGDRRAQQKLTLVRSSTALLSGVEMRTSGAQSLRVNGGRSAVGRAGDYVLIVYLAYSGPKLEESCEG
jgi:hypothetical protein